VKIVQQSIWPVSVFGLGFLLLVIGLSGVANIQETRRINEQILAAEDNYRQVEKLIEAIQSDISRVAVLRRDRLLDEDESTAVYPPQLAALRSKIKTNLAKLRALRLEQNGDAFERVETSLQDYLNTAAAEFQEEPTPKTRSALVRNGFESQNMTILAIAGELGKLNEANFEMRRQALNGSVKFLQKDIAETILTALILGTVIAGASVFRISTLERQSAQQQKATEQAERRLRHLSQQLVSSQEQERKALSRELHDQIGQLLTALRMELGNLERTRTAAGEEADPHLEQAKKLAESTLRTTRDIAMGLRPAMLDVLGLGPALEWQAREFTRRYRIPIQLEIEGDIKDVPDPHRTYLYRIVQEGLTNCARHAQAKNIRVSLEDANGQLTACVEDDGVGFDQHGGVVQGLGLLGMAERVRELCGSLSILSEPGKGTRISVRLPLNQAPNSEPSAISRG
jgi:signal transduction histidine kinase